VAGSDDSRVDELAFSRSGRLSVMTATSPRTSYSICEYSFPLGHRRARTVTVRIEDADKERSRFVDLMANSTSDDSALLVDRQGPILTLTLNRPKRKNALTRDMVLAITQHVFDAGADDETRVVVIRSTGDDFCTGMDLGQSNRERGSGSDDPEQQPAKPRIGHLQRSFQVGPHRMIATMEQAQVPIIASVRGWAAGIGNSLALSADFVIAGPTAKFWVPFVTKGFTPDSGNTWLLPRLVGLSRAKQMIMRGRPIDGQTAAEWGLVAECVPDHELDNTVDALASEMAAAATASVGFAKTLIHRNLEVGLNTALQTEGIYEEVAVRSDDFKEGMRAFAERREPRYTGR
jgi:2-(1,2-epoxy-1,2-dihydrophenyl)acetyl-CoA isomerase